MAWLEALFWLILRWTLYAVAAALTLALLLLPRFLWVLPRRDGSHNSNSAKRTMPCKTALVLGSGGHTTELLLLLSSLDPAKYTPRTYFVSSGDTMSSSKADKLESGEWCSEENLDSSSSTDSTKSGRYEVVILPRARNVHQSWLSTPLSTLLSFAACVRAVIPRSRRAMPFTDLVLMNGPGTCVPLVAAVYVNKMLALPAPKLVYVESFARVQSLSLTARILRPLVDVFVTQWPQDLAASGAVTGRSTTTDNQDISAKWLV